jgi:hypothetical protein
MMATQELVVPRSMPITFAMIVSPFILFCECNQPLNKSANGSAIPAMHAK